MVHRNKLDESRVVIRNKAGLVAKSYNQEDKINFDEIFILIARPEGIRLSILGFIVIKCWGRISLL